MNTTITFARGFAIPKAQFAELTNPLAVNNLYGKGGRSHYGDERGVSFSTIKPKNEEDLPRALQESKRNGEYYAKVRMANKEEHVPVVVTFNLTEDTFSILRGKVGIPSASKFGENENIVVDPIKSFDELKSLPDGEVIVQAGDLTPEQLKQLNVEIGTASIGKEGQRVSLNEALSSNVEFNYTPFEAKAPALEGVNPSLGENGTMMK